MHPICNVRELNVESPLPTCLQRKNTPGILWDRESFHEALQQNGKQHGPVREIYASVGHKLDKWDRYFDVGLWCPNILLSLEAWKNLYLLLQKGNVLTLTFHMMNHFEQ